MQSKGQTSQSTSPSSQNNNNQTSKRKKKTKDKGHGNKKSDNDQLAKFSVATSSEEVLELKEDLIKVLKRCPSDFHKTKKILKVFQSKDMTLDILRSTLVGKVITNAQGQFNKVLKNGSVDEIDDAKKVKKCLKICDNIIDHWKNSVFKKSRIGQQQNHKQISPLLNQQNNENQISEKKQDKKIDSQTKKLDNDLQKEMKFKNVTKHNDKEKDLNRNAVSAAFDEMLPSEESNPSKIEPSSKQQESESDDGTIKVIEFDKKQVGHLRQLLPTGPIGYRENMRLKFFDIFSKVQYQSHQWDPKTLVHQLPKISIQLEIALQKAYPVPRNYATKARSLVFNLGDPKNPNLRLRVLEGKISTTNLISADAKLLASEDLQTERKKIQTDDMNARRTDWQQEQQKERMKDGKTQGFFTCYKCRSKQTTFHQMQTRGADEPMTNFVLCLKCGNRWRC